MALLNLNDDNLQETIAQGITLVDFSANWWGSCKMISPFLDQVDQETDIKIGKVDIDQAPKLVNTYGVMSIPTLVLFKDGEIIDQKVGFMTKEQILAFIDEAK